jgi:hypothetical protein
MFGRRPLMRRVRPEAPLDISFKPIFDTPSNLR